MKKSHIIAIVVIAVAIGAILSTFSDSSTYASFKEAADKPDTEFHVVGVLNKEKEMMYNPQEDANKFSFFLVDREGTEKLVHFRGTKPQDFEKSEQVVITGKMDNEAFVADKILMKCPSKYNDGSSEMTEFTATMP
jgi:cytochrome c-type biogenesis protein CcmE